MKNYKAPSNDEVAIEVVKQYELLILAMFNACLNRVATPSQLKKVSPLFMRLFGPLEWTITNFESRRVVDNVSSS